eukprot:1065939-Amphidinium_carterae.1
MNSSLVLHKRDKEASTTCRAPNGRARPPPLSKMEWREIAAQHVPNPDMVILHTDGAHAYGPQSDYHTRVIHSGSQPVYAQQQMAGSVQVIAGTQSMDATWGALKNRVRFANRDEEVFDDSIRFAQWLHWTQGRD